MLQNTEIVDIMTS